MTTVLELVSSRFYLKLQSLIFTSKLYYKSEPKRTHPINSVLLNQLFGHICQVAKISMYTVLHVNQL